MIPRAAHVSDEAIREYIGRIHVSVNGIKQSCVISYDTDAGTVERYETTPDSKFVISDDQFATEIVRGTVEVWVE